MSDLYAVFGNPVEHSQSPLIHRLFAEQTQQALFYEKRLAPLDGFKQAVLTFLQEGGKGLNITVPFKQQALDLAHHLSDSAKQAGAVNTLVLEASGLLTGHNTDGLGLLNDLTRNLAWPIANRRVLVLGAGGAVRGVLAPLLAQKPSQLVIANRTVAKAQALAELFHASGNVCASAYETLPDQTFDLIINGTSASLSDDLPPLKAALIAPDSHCYDMMYGKGLTVFLQWAQQHGCQHLADGLGMLVEQAAEAFYLWRGVKPETAAVIQALKA